ncbi:aldose 1-epimerase [Gemmatimonadetes bacterium T265]|nr:aldose 1-epimerase [Gemmatimonadetes bacterium T265]
MSARVTTSAYGTAPGGAAVELYTIEAGDTRVSATSYGGHLTEIAFADAAGAAADVALGYDDLAAYVADTAYFGALVGRYANRIAGGRFTLDGETYTLATNNGPNALHGGLVGFSRVVWDAEPFERGEAGGVVLRHASPDGDQGYPGALDVRVTYTVTEDALTIDYRAVSDEATPVNLTQHSYWNLAGHAAGSIAGHELTLAAARFTPVDATLIPTGERRAVGGTPFDFRAPHAIGARIDDDDEQLRIGGGYDHNYVVDRAPEDEPDALAFAARLYEPRSGRVLDVHTTEPGIQFYSGNMIPGGLAGKGGARYGRRSGLALETQHFPDSPNQPSFPSTILRPGRPYTSRTVYRFSSDERG